MQFFLALVYAAVFILVCRNSLKKRPGVYYITVGAAVVALSLASLYGLVGDFPLWLSNYVFSVIYRGSLSTALFVAVMYAGALDGKKQPGRTLLYIRTELSITACILALGHNAVYGYTYFAALFVKPGGMKPEHLIAAVISLVLIAIMLPLFVTSFPRVRRKMKAKTWKRLQRLAYPFYGLLYAHVMVLFAPRIAQSPDYAIGAALYTAVFGIYAVLRVAKYMRVKRARGAHKAISGAGEKQPVRR